MLNQNPAASRKTPRVMVSEDWYNPAFSLATGTYIAASTTVSIGYIGPSVGETVVISNLTSGNAYCWFDGNAVTVSVGAGYLVLPNSQRAVGISPYQQNVAVILDSGSGHVYVERGTGAAR